jgi:insecticidal toxin complex protein TccC
MTHLTERFVYAGSSVAEQSLNLAGQSVRHYDTAGRVQLNGLSLSGVPLS